MKVIDYLFNPKKIIFYLGIRGHFRFLSDEAFLKMMYWCRLNRKLNLDNPKNYNEKLQWMKLYYRNPASVEMVDKYLVKNYISSLLGEEYVIPLYGVWDDFDKIDFDSLPNQFVIKCTHDSGGVVVCKDKNKLDINKTRRKINKCLKKNYFWAGREWMYKEVQPRIIIEKYLVDESGNDLKDYKVMCFNGEPKLVELHTQRFTDKATQDFYDIEWNKTSISQSGLSEFQKNTKNYPKPRTFDKMLYFSRIIAKDLPHVRVDWYSVEDKLYFGEITFFDGSGFDPYDNYKDDELLGSWIQLPPKKTV